MPRRQQQQQRAASVEPGKMHAARERAISPFGATPVRVRHYNRAVLYAECDR
jgi:hypothetical protein